MPSPHTAFDAFLYIRICLFESLEATKESLDQLDHAIDTDSALLTRSTLAEFAFKIPSLYMERAVNALENYFQQSTRKYSHRGTLRSPERNLLLWNLFSLVSKRF